MNSKGPVEGAPSEVLSEQTDEEFAAVEPTESEVSLIAVFPLPVTPIDDPGDARQSPKCCLCAKLDL